jgi:hypothetical protein
MRTAAVLCVLVLAASCQKPDPSDKLHHQCITMTTSDGKSVTDWSCEGDAKVSQSGNRYSVQYTDYHGTKIYHADLISVGVRPIGGKLDYCRD